MARIPDKRALDGASYGRRDTVSLSGGAAIGQGVARLGGALTEIGEERKREDDALDLIKADAAYKTGIYETERNFDEDPNYQSFEPRFRDKAGGITESAAANIRNPRLREKWALQTATESEARLNSVLKRGQSLERQDKFVEVEGALKSYQSLYTDPKSDERTRRQSRADIEAAITAAEQNGVLEPKAAAALRENYSRGSVIVDAETRLLNDPVGLRGDLTGSGAAAKPKNDAIGRAAQETGVPDHLLRTFAQIESGGNAKAKTGSYKGLYQLSDAEFEKHGGGDIYNADDNARAAAKKISAEAVEFERKYGREPSATDLYLIHQQGKGGYEAHVSNPDLPAWMNMHSTGEGRQKGEAWAKQAIWGNIPDDVKEQFGSVEDVTSADFIKLWDRKIHRIGGTAGDVSPRYAELTPLERAEFTAKARKQENDILEKQRDEQRARSILSGELPVDPGSSDDRKTINKAFDAMPLLDGIANHDWQASDDLAKLAGKISYIPERAFNTLRGMALNGTDEDRHYAYQTLGRIMRERPAALSTSGGEGFSKDLADEVETFNTMITDVGLPVEQALSRINQMRSPEFQARRQSLKKEANEVVKDLSLDDLTREYSGFLTSRPAAGGSDRRASFMLDAYRDMVSYHYIRSGDAELAKKVALNEMKKAYKVSTITGNKRLMAHAPETYYPPIETAPGETPSFEYFQEELKRAVNERAGRLQIIDTDVNPELRPVAGREASIERGDQIPLEDIFLDVNSQTYADLAAGNPYPSYGVVWRQTDENGIPAFVAVPGNFYVDVKAAKEKQSTQRRGALREAGEGVQTYEDEWEQSWPRRTYKGARDAITDAMNDPDAQPPGRDETGLPTAP